MPDSTEMYSEEYFQYLIDCDLSRAGEVLKNAESRYEPNQIIEKIIVSTMFRIGEVWSQGKAALTQVYARRNYGKGNGQT
jgi:methanogenic corrinoid protein MtbC1